MGYSLDDEGATRRAAERAARAAEPSQKLPAGCTPIPGTDLSGKWYSCGTVLITGPCGLRHVLRSHQRRAMAAWLADEA